MDIILCKIKQVASNKANSDINVEFSVLVRVDYLYMEYPCLVYTEYRKHKLLKFMQKIQIKPTLKASNLLKLTPTKLCSKQKQIQTIPSTFRL